MWWWRGILASGQPRGRDDGHRERRWGFVASLLQQLLQDAANDVRILRGQPHHLRACALRRPPPPTGTPALTGHAGTHRHTARTQQHGTSWQTRRQAECCRILLTNELRMILQRTNVDPVKPCPTHPATLWLTAVRWLLALSIGAAATACDERALSAQSRFNPRAAYSMSSAGQRRQRSSSTRTAQPPHRPAALLPPP
jgi:hypothetical protein